MTGTWIWGLLRRRGARLTATATGIAIAIALLSCLGSFLAAAQHTMTARAVRSVTVDWQVAVHSGAPTATVLDAVGATPGVRDARPVGFADTTGLAATTTTGTTATTTQTTGPGKVLGLPADYATTFPGSLRLLTGTGHGVLLAQQTAANLHVTPGDTITIGRAGLPATAVRVTGIVDLPQADSLFQTVGAPPATQPTAPPDNVVLLDQPLWHTLFAPLATSRPGLVTTQVHATLDHTPLPPDPASAYTHITTAAHNLEARAAGTATVGDNLAAALDAARSDAAYARILFLFLGLPAAVLAGLLTSTVVATGAPRRRNEQAVLRARGATPGQLLRLAAVEAALVGTAGAAAGLAVGALVGQIAFGSPRFGATPATAATWAATAVAFGLAIAAATILTPAWRDLRTTTVTAGRTVLTRARGPRWARYGLDLILLAAAGIMFWLTSRTGYTLVLAPEGVPTISVSYWAFAAPALLWTGAALLAWRITDLLLGHGRRAVTHLLRPVSGTLSRVVANSLSRQRTSLARAVVLLGLAFAFAVSTATFNATYRAQAEVDAQLTNGADVTVTESPGTYVPPTATSRLTATPGVRAVEPIQHRFAYIGTDLQDLYGVRPTTITRATALQDAYFQGGTATQLLHRLAIQPDSILVSAETVKDFQLAPGDPIKLRLQDGRTKQPTTVTFHYIGIVTEFPTAPKDSFFVANATYIARHTGTDTVGAFLVDTGGTNTTTVARAIRSRLGPAATVTDIAHSRTTIGSSLTAVDLAGLTRVELGFGIALAAAAAALVLGLGLAERRRTFAIATALGATPRHLRSFITAEAATLTLGGLTTGAALGAALSHLLVTVLTGVFDPPPTTLTVPWTYLIATTATVLTALTAVTIATTRLSRLRRLSL